MELIGSLILLGICLVAGILVLLLLGVLIGSFGPHLSDRPSFWAQYRDWIRKMSAATGHASSTVLWMQSSTESGSGT